MRDLVLRVGLLARDRLSGTLSRTANAAGGLRGKLGGLKSGINGIGRAADAVSPDLRAAANRVRELEQTSDRIDGFRKIKKSALENAKSLERARAKASALGKELAETKEPTDKQRQAFDKAKASADRFARKSEELQGKLKSTRSALRDAGISTRELGTAKARVRRDIDGAKRALEAEGRALDQVRQKQQALARARASARNRYQTGRDRAGAMAGGGARAAAAGAAGLYGGSRMASDGIDFGETMSSVAAVGRLDTAGAAFQKLKQQAKELGATTHFSASEAAGGMKFLAQAGFEASEIMASMPAMLDLAKAGGENVGLAQTADIASNILGGFRLESDQMGRVADVLAGTFTRSNVDLVMLGDTMKYVAPIAAEFGTSVEDAAAMAGLLGDIGIQGSMAGTALRALHNRLAAPPPRAEKAISQIGLATRTATGDMRAMTDILADVARKTATMGAGQRLEIFKNVAGEEAGAAMAALVNKQGASGISKFSEILRNVDGEAKRIAETMGDNWGGDLRALASAAEGFNIALTELNNSPLRDLTQNITEIVRAATRWVETNPELASTLTQVAAGAFGVLAVVGTLALAIGGLMVPFAIARYGLDLFGISISKRRKGLGGLRSDSRGAGRALRALGGVAANVGRGAIATLGRALRGGGRAATWLESAMLRAAPVIAGALRTIAIAAMANPIGLVIGAIAGLATLLVIYWRPISAYFSGLWNRVTRTFTAAWAWIRKKVSFSPMATIRAAWSGLSAVFSGKVDVLPSIVDGAWSAIKTAVSFSPIGLVAQAWRGLAALLGFKVNPLADIAAGVWDAIKATIGFSPIATVTEAWSGISDTFTSVLDDVDRNFGETWDGIIAKAKELLKPLKWIADKVADIFGDDDETESTDAARPRRRRSRLRTAGPGPGPAFQVAPPPPPAASAAVSPGASASVRPSTSDLRQNVTVQITVNAAPGMDESDLAERIRREVEQFMTGVNRSALFDGVS